MNLPHQHASHHPPSASACNGAAPPNGKPSGTRATPATSPATSPAASSPESNSPVPLSPEMQRAQEIYLKTGPTHPDALGGLIAPIVAKEAGITFRLQELCERHLSQPQLEFCDLAEAQRVLETLNASMKQLRSLAGFEYQMRKKRMETDNPVESISYHVKPETTPLNPEAKFVAEFAMKGKSPPPPLAYPENTPVFPPKPSQSEKPPV